MGLPAPPTIIDQPQDASILPGQSATFSVTAVGAAPLAYQWRFNDVDMPGATSSALTFAPAGVMNAGAYSVRVTNGYGAAFSSNAVLAVIVATTAGDNTFHQTDVPALATNLVAIAAGAWHSLGLRADGTVVAWGDNSGGQCAVPGTLTDAVAIAAGGYHSLAIKANGAVVAWGANDYGQTDVPADLANVIGIAAGTWHSVALRANGTVAVWGDNSFGQTNLPVGLTNVMAVAAGGNHSLALKADGTVVAWGENTDAEGNVAGQSVVPWGLTNVVAIAAGEYHSLAVKADGTVVAWGDNSQDQCDVPAGLTNVVAVAGGGAHSLALQGGRRRDRVGRRLERPVRHPVRVVPGGGDCRRKLSYRGAPGGRHAGAAADESGQERRPVQRAGADVEPEELRPGIQGFTGRDELGRRLHQRGNGALRMLTDPSAVAPQRFYRMRQW